MTELSAKATKNWVLVLTSLGSFMAALDALVVTTALGTIRQDFNTSIEALEWTVNAFTSWTEIASGVKLCGRKS